MGQKGFQTNFNWAAALILILTAPLIPLFMILVGMAAAESSQQNMDVLAKLSAQFLFYFL